MPHIEANAFNGPDRVERRKVLAMLFGLLLVMSAMILGVAFYWCRDLLAAGSRLQAVCIGAPLLFVCANLWRAYAKAFRRHFP